MKVFGFGFFLILGACSTPDVEEEASVLEVDIENEEAIDLRDIKRPRGSGN